MDEDVAVTSKYLQTVLKEDPNCESIQTNIPYESLDIAKRFLEYHVNKPMDPIPKPLADTQNFANNVKDQFDANLVINLNRDQIFRLLYAAQTLQNDSLISLCAAYMASMINGKNVNELRDFFQVLDDLTEEEKLQIEKENSCFRL